MAQDYSAPPSIPPVEEPKRNNTLMIVIIVILVLLCCCCGLLAFLWFYGDAILNSMGIQYMFASLLL